MQKALYSSLFKSHAKYFIAFFMILTDCPHYPCSHNLYLSLPIPGICLQLKAIHNITKYALYLR